MGGAPKRRWALLAALVAGAVVAVIALAGGGKSRKESSSNTQPAATTQANAAPPARPEPVRKVKRQRFRRGHGLTPDEPAPGTLPLLAIADQKPQTFSDPYFRQLGVARSRLNTPWNSIFTEPGRLATWLNGARAAGVEPLIAFEHARGDLCPSKPCGLPSVSAYARAIEAFHRAYPWVHLLQPWNEANSSTQPTGKHPERAAAYYEALKRVCPGCIVIGADLLDATNLARWFERFKGALHGPLPRLWGLHNYTDTNRFRDAGTKRMLALVPGEVWVTETGGIVSFKTADGRVALPYDENRAASAIRYLFKLARLSPRITRIYIYQWKIDFPGNRFDAGLVGLDGKPRPALQVVLQHRPLLR